MSKYKFKLKEEAEAAQREIISNSWIGATEQNENYITVKSQSLTPDLVKDIEDIIKRHGGKAVLVFSI